MKYEGDAALVSELLNRQGEIEGKDFFTFENHYDLWVPCKVCKKTYHTSLFVSDMDKFKENGTLPDYLSENGRSLLTKSTCSKCI